MSPARPSTLWHLTSGRRRFYSLAIVAMAGTNVFLFGAPLIGKFAIDVLEQSDPTLAIEPLWQLASWWMADVPILGYLWLTAIGAVMLTVLGGAFLYLRGRLAALASESIVRELRERIYNQLHHVGAGYYDTADTGDLVQRASSDVETIRVFLASDVIEIGRAIMLLVCVAPVFFYLDTRLAWLSLCLMPFLAAGAYVFFSRVKRVFQLTDEAEAALTATLQENLTGIRVVRAFARQDFEVAKFAERNADFRAHNYRLIRLMGWYWGTTDFFAMTQIGIVLLSGAIFIMDGTLTVGDLFAFMTLESIVIWPVRQLGRVLTDTGKAVVALGRINEVLDEPPEPAGLVPASGRAQGVIDIQGLSFGYDSARPVLDGIDIHVPAGETLAIVGPPGSGKSTLIRMLLKLYPYSEGSIRVDGVELSGLDRHWLRAQIAVVMQEPFLYSTTVRENLAVGRASAPDSEVLGACRDAAILETIHTFPDGFSAMVGERGVTLSGGQRQRIALARALLKDPPILVLDDSLSAVDTGTEGHILSAIRGRRGRHTTLIIAHRLSSVMGADRIMVLEHGRVAQLGTHDELVAQPGTYRRLCEIQSALDSSIARDTRVS